MHIFEEASKSSLTIASIFSMAISGYLPYQAIPASSTRDMHVRYGACHLVMEFFIVVFHSKILKDGLMSSYSTCLLDSWPRAQLLPFLKDGL